MWILYLLLVLTEIAGAFFAPASWAAFPNLVDSDHLYTANALSGSTWGTTLAIGSALGGLISLAFGREACFAANSLSFLIAGLIMLTINRPLSSGERKLEKTEGWSDLKKGLRYALTHPHEKKLLVFEACFGFATGAVVLYSIFAVKVFHKGDFGIGFLYTIRGIANFPGPILVRQIVGEDLRSLWRGMVGSGLCIALFYGIFSISPTLGMAAIPVFGAHMANAAFWVLASLYLQRTVPDEFLGRVASLNTVAFTLFMLCSTLGCGFFVQHASPRTAALLFGVLVFFFSLFTAAATRRDMI